MKKLLITATGALLIMSAGITVAGDYERGYGKRPQHAKGGMHAMPVVERVMRGIRRLDLDETQETAVREIFQGLREDMRPIMQETRDNHEQLKDLVKAEDFDEGAVAALAEKEGEMAAERMLLTSKALSEAYGVLTSEQRDELETMAEERKERRMSRQEKRAERRDASEG